MYCQIKSSIAVAKDAFNKKRAFTSKIHLELRKKLANATFGV
jgi:hypothetical protein